MWKTSEIVNAISTVSGNRLRLAIWEENNLFPTKFYHRSLSVDDDGNVSDSDPLAKKCDDTDVMSSGGPGGSAGGSAGGSGGSGAGPSQSDTSLWLHNKLGTSNDSWTGGSIVSQLNPELLNKIQNCFQVKNKV